MIFRKAQRDEDETEQTERERMWWSPDGVHWRAPQTWIILTEAAQTQLQHVTKGYYTSIQKLSETLQAETEK